MTAKEVLYILLYIPNVAANLLSVYNGTFCGRFGFAESAVRETRLIGRSLAVAGCARRMSGFEE